MPRILVVDDSESVLTFLHSVLQREPYEVMSTLSGAKALEILQKEAVDLVITDIYMPPPDGLEIMSRVRAMKLDVAFIAISSYPASLNMFAAARSLGAQIALAKPLSSEDLIAAVQAVLDAKLGGAHPQSRQTSGIDTMRGNNFVSQSGGRAVRSHWMTGPEATP